MKINRLISASGKCQRTSQVLHNGIRSSMAELSTANFCYVRVEGEEGALQTANTQ